MFVAIGLAVFLFTRLDDEIRRQVQLKLAEQFPQFNISVGGARLVEGQGIAIYDLAISETSSTQLQNNLLVVDEIMFSCDAKLTELVKGLPEVHRVVVRHPQVWAAKGRNGRWNLESLLPLPECGNSRPQIVIENAHFTLADQSRQGLPPLSLRDINLTINPKRVLKVAAPTELNLISDSEASKVFDIRGTFGGPDGVRAEIQAACDLVAKSFSLTGKFEQLNLNPSLLAWVASFKGEALRDVTLLGKVDGEISCEHRLGSTAQPKVNAKLSLYQARLEHPQLPSPLVELSCLVQCDNQMLSVRELKGNCGTARVVAQLERRGWSSNAPLAAGIRLENVALNQQLYASLPAILRDQWNKYEPTGIVDAEAQVTFDGQQWRPNAKLTGRDLAFESDKFRYRVKDGYGTMIYTPAEQNAPPKLDINLVGYSGGQPLSFVGRVFDPKPGALGWVEVTGNNVKIEEEMIAALPDKTRQVIESMHPRGRFNLRWRLDRMQPGQIKPHTALRLELINCQVNYEKFPYPLDGIQGLILAEDQRWTFRDLATTGSRRVQCQGYLQPVQGNAQLGNELFLSFTGQQIPLDDDLRQALSPSVQRAWQELRPRGNIDMQAKITHLTGAGKPTIQVTVNPLPESTVIQPVFFPYLMEELEGTISYSDGELLLSKMRAKHGHATTIRTNGSGRFNEDGSWNVRFVGLAADKLTPRRDLTDALPSKLQKLIEYLKPSGYFNLSKSELAFSKAASSQAPIEANWDIELNFIQANLQAGIDLHNIHGGIRLKGATRGDHSYSAGELAIDTATFQDIQFTQITGPFWVDPTRCLFGSWATSQQGLPLRRLKARVYDGEVIADAGVSFDIVPDYSAIAMLTGANLKRMMKERIDGQLDYSGNVAATLTLSGKGRSVATLNGHGEVRITDANIYELPILVSMLKVLRNETPNTTAFNQVDSTFRIQGPHVYLDKLDFKGDAVTLKGRGETDFDHKLDLDFHAVIGRDEIRLPLVKKFVNRVGEQTLQLTVDGTLSEPIVSTQALPVFNQLIQNLQTDPSNNPPAAEAPRSAERVSPTWPLWGRQ